MAVTQAATASGQVAHPSLEERHAEGREARDRVPPASHSRWRPAADRSIAGFSERYAHQNEEDYAEFVTAIRSGRLKAVEGV